MSDPFDESLIYQINSYSPEMHDECLSSDIIQRFFCVVGRTFTELGLSVSRGIFFNIVYFSGAAEMLLARIFGLVYVKIESDLPVNSCSIKVNFCDIVLHEYSTTATKTFIAFYQLDIIPPFFDSASGRLSLHTCEYRIKTSLSIQSNE